MTDGLRGGIDAAKDTIHRPQSAAKHTADAAKDAAAEVPEKARRVIGDNAVLIGGFGIAIGAIIAAALPKSEAEAKVMDAASDGVKQIFPKVAHAFDHEAPFAARGINSAAEYVEDAAEKIRI